MNEFDGLIDYLESFNNKKLFNRPQKNQVKQSVEKIKEEIKIDEYKNIYSDIQTQRKDSNISSVGFDVQKFLKLCSNKLCIEFESMQNYERPYLSVTELTQCIRKSYYQRLKFPIDIQEMFRYGNLLLIQEVGKEIHSIIQNIYEFKEIEKVVIDEKYKIKGRLDALNNNFLYEIKSIDDSKFNGSYIQSHLDQGCVYCYIANTYYGMSLNKISIIYVARSLKNIYSFDLDYDQKISNKYLNYATILKESIDSKKVPEKINFDEEQCKWCSYKKYCNKEEDIKITEVKNEPVFLL